MFGEWNPKRSKRWFRATAITLFIIPVLAGTLSSAMSGRVFTVLDCALIIICVLAYAAAIFTV